MRVVASIPELLDSLRGARLKPPEESPRIITGFGAIDSLLPGEGFALGAVHEFLSQTDTPALLLPLLVARAAANAGWVVWCDVSRQFYPPAAAALGLPLDRLLLVQPSDERQALWVTTESLRCRGVGACVAPVTRLPMLHARRLQLAAERGGGVGLLLRPAQAVSRPYAAKTRWLIKPAQGERSVQRSVVRMIHGHGGRVDQDVLLEVCRETHHVRAAAAVAHRQSAPKKAASA